MEAERWRRVNEIVQSALEQDPDALPQYLESACAGDAELREKVLGMLALQDEAEDFLEVKAIDIVTSGFIKDSKALSIKHRDNDAQTVVQASLIGRKLGDFIITEKLGEGGFGAIYRATQSALNREAIIKIINETSSQNHHYREMFTREAQLASRLEHPYTASIYAFGVEPDGLLWIAMEFVRGEPLNNLLKQHGPLPLSRFVPFFNKICEVVQTAHEAGIIHRDLKPANIMVITRAGRLLPKLLDFGIAKSLVSTEEPLSSANAASIRISAKNSSQSKNNSQSKRADDLTVSGLPQELQPIESSHRQTPSSDWTIGVGGSPPYMAPEQWHPNTMITVRADIYALGVLCYEVLKGKRPFQGEVPALFQAHHNGEIPSLGDAFAVETATAIDRVIARAMAKRPEDRFASALEFATALQDAAGIVDDQLGLISLDNRLRESLFSSAPQPIAEAIANLDTARNLYQAREQIVEVVRACVRYLGIIALAFRTTITDQDQSDSELAMNLLRKLRSDHLDEKEWFDLTRELCRPFAQQPEHYPLPQLISFFFESNSDKSPDQIDRLEPLLKLSQIRIASGSNDQLRALLNQMMLQLAILLRSLSFLSDYQLVVPFLDYHEVWMGNRQRRIFTDLKGQATKHEPMLVNGDGEIIVSLSPFVVITEPTLGARPELFLLEGFSNQKAKFIALPSSFEHTNTEFWPWFDQLFMLNQQATTAIVIEQTPYPGLNAFDAKDAAIFVGREKETEYFLNRLRIQPLLVLAGPSGAGKSSFIQAGVIPNLVNGRAITVRPGATPLATLATKLLHEGINRADLRLALANDPLLLGRQLHTLAVRDSCQIILIIDQLEELFTLCHDQQERELYARILVMAATTVEVPVRVICTLRDDFLARVRTLSLLGERLAQGLELLTTPKLDNLVRILVEPARRAGYQFEDQQLPVEMATEVADRPMALPLLAFAAAKIWELRDRPAHQLKRETYQKLGGVGGALAQHAEDLLHQMQPPERKYLREAFRQLVTNEGTRAVLARKELTQLLGNNPEAQAMLEKLITSRLLTAYESEDGIESIEVAHESLLTAWPRLVKWQQEDAEGTRLRDQLREAARQWQERGQPKGLLWRDEALAELKLWQSRYATKLTEREQAFSEMSFAEAARSQRRRRLLYVSALVVLLAALSAAFLINREIENQLLESYLDKGRQELVNGRPMQAAVYFSQAYNQGVETAALKLLLGEAMKSVDIAQIAAFRGHTFGINQARFSPDGRRVITASDDRTAKVWDVATSKMLYSIDGHKDEVLNATFSNNGQLIATASRDSTAKIWDAATGKLLTTLTGHSAAVRTIQFSPDDQRIVTTSEDKTVKIWQVSNGELLFTINSVVRDLSAVFSPDGARLLTGGTDNIARLWDANNGNLLFTIEGHTGGINGAVFNSDGTKIATASNDLTAKIWNAANGKLLASLEGHKGGLTSIAFSADGKLIATSSTDKSVAIWNAKNYQKLTSLELHIGYIFSVDFNPSATQIVTASFDGSAKIWGINKFRNAETQLVNYRIGASVAEYSRDGKLIMTSGGGNEVRLFDGQSLQLLRSIKVSERDFKYTIATLSPNGKLIATANYYDPDNLNNFQMVSNLDKLVTIWDSETGALVRTLPHEKTVVRVTFSHNGKQIVTLSNKVVVWDVATGAHQITLADALGNVISAEFSPDDRQIITGHADGSVKLWDTETGRLLRLFQIHSMFVTNAYFTADGKGIVTGSVDATAKLIDATTGRLICSFNGHSNDVTCAAFSNDGQLLATASRDGTARIWNAANGKLLITFQGHSGVVNCANFSPDQHNLITAGNDGTVRIWPIPQETREPKAIARIIEQRVPYRFDNGQLLPVVSKPIN